MKNGVFLRFPNCSFTKVYPSVNQARLWPILEVCWWQPGNSVWPNPGANTIVDWWGILPGLGMTWQATSHNRNTSQAVWDGIGIGIVLMAQMDEYYMNITYCVNMVNTTNSTCWDRHGSCCVHGASKNGLHIPGSAIFDKPETWRGKATNLEVHV